MRIMQIVSGGDVNGAIVHCALLTEELILRGHQLTVVCPNNAWIGGRAAEAGATIVHSDLHRWPTDELRRVSALIRDEKIDVVHTHMSRAHAFGVLLRYYSGVACVATAHNRYMQLHWMLNDRVIGVSDATTRFHRRFNLVRNRRIDTIHNFVDLQRFAADRAAARKRVRDEFGFADRNVVVGQVGDVIPRKGMIHLVRAMPRLLAASSEARLLIVGDSKNSDDYLASVKSEAKRLRVDDAIRWAGRRSDVADVLSAIDVCALASLEESFPLSVLEAMAARLPVVATAVGGLPECVVDGETGRLVPPGDSVALAEALVSLLIDPSLRAALGEAGRSRVEEHFSPQSQAPRIESVFEQAIAGRRAA